ncbi:hypothetical protein HZA98_03595 [Candidatus Woesearchaeota archaeon]|nr:hypothetical protein [Candidatus Woesearchaeota archaeon]
MNPYPTWSIILGSLVLLYLGYSLGGFFQINYVIGALGLILGIYNLLWRKK